MTTPPLMRRLAAVTLLALSLATFAPVGLSLAGAAGDKDSSKNTGQTARPDAGGNAGEQKGDLSGRKLGESHSNDDHTKNAPAQPTAPKADVDNGKARDADNDKKARDVDNDKKARDADNDNKARDADNDNKAKDVDSPGCAFGNDQKNGQLATAPGCTKDDRTKAKVNDDTNKPDDTQKAKTDDDTNKPDDANKPTANQPLVATPSQPITIVVTTPITTPSGIIPAGTTVTILVGTVPVSGQVLGATISAPGVPAFSAPPFTADVAGVTIQQAPESQVAAAAIPDSLPRTGGGHGQQ